MTDIYSALAAVMADCKSVAKRDRNNHQNFMFRGIDAVVNAVGPILREHSVSVLPTVDRVTYETVHTTNGKPATACRLVATYTFYASDGSSVAATVAGEAWDSGDKATPKAMSVAFRTALLQALTLPTDESDPDSHTYERDHRPAERHTSTPDGDPWQADAPRGPSDKQLEFLRQMFAKAHIDESDRPAYIKEVIGREVAASREMTTRECSQVIDRLKSDGDA